MSHDHPLSLTREEARLLAEQLAVLTKAGAPLASGLYAAAAEIPSRRLAEAMEQLARQIESGRPLDDVIRASLPTLPPHIVRLIETGLRAGNLPDVLAQVVEIDRSSYDLRRSIRAAVAYPLLLMALCTGLLVLIAVFVVPGMVSIYSDFGSELPWTTRSLVWFSGKEVMQGIGAGIAGLTMALFGLRVSMAPQNWRGMLTRIPVFGPMLLWRAVANWSRLASLLFRQGLPTPEAMRLAGTGVNDAYMAVEGLRIARACEQGRGLADAIDSSPRLPASIGPLVRWGEQHGALPDAFETVAEMFENRLRHRAALLRFIMPPIAFVLVGLMGLWLMNAMYSPLLELIQSLSGGIRRRGSTQSSGVTIDPVWAVVGTFVVLWGIAGLAMWIRSTRFISGGSTGLGESSGRPILRFLLTLFIWAAVLYLLLVMMVMLGGLLGVLLWIFAIIVIIATLSRRNDIQRRSLLWLLGTSVQKGVPLPAVARAFGDERRDRLGMRTRQLAFQLERGVPLDQAVERSSIRLPTDVLVAVRTAYATGSMSTVVEATAERDGSIERVSNLLSSRMLYLMVFLIAAASVIIFLLIKIIPAYIKIFDDFGSELPRSTVFFINISNAMFESSVLGFWIMAGLLAALIYATMKFSGVLRWDPPLVRRFTLPLDQAIVLRNLAAAVERGAPLPEMVHALALNYPKGYICSKLLDAGNRIARGEVWAESLRASGLLKAADAGLLKTAERVGNLPWAMRELAKRLTQRFAMRAGVALGIAFPVALFLFALIVFGVSYGMIEPLAQLVQDLSGGGKRR